MIIFPVVKSKKGSTLIMALLALSVLTILGTAILSLGVTNFKMKVVDRNVKTSFYLAEAGLDEAYGVTVLEIEKAIESGNLEVDLQKSNWNSPESPSDTIVNSWFQNGYTNYLNTYLKNKIINYDYGILDSGIANDKAAIAVVSYHSYSTEIVMVLQSSFIYNNVSKSLKAKFTILIPEYNGSETKGENMLQLIDVSYYYN